MKTSKESRYLSRRSFMKKAGIAITALAFSKNTILAQSPNSSFSDSMELVIDFELKSKGKKPYAAVWIEDWTGSSVRTLVLWMQSNKGEKYLPDLRRWYRNERNNTNLIRTVSSPTRRAGQYTVVWDGKNDSGQALAAGEYYLCVESAREDGPYNLIRERINLASSSFQETFLGNAELGDVHVEFRERL